MALQDLIERKEKEQQAQSLHAQAISGIHDIQSVIDYVEKESGCECIFDDSRAWALYTTEKPADEKTPGYCRKYGAYRDYLGGGIRGALCCNLTGELNDLFTSALRRIESIYNGDGAYDCESWEQATGVLL